MTARRDAAAMGDRTRRAARRGAALDKIRRGPEIETWTTEEEREGWFDECRRSGYGDPQASPWYAARRRWVAACDSYAEAMGWVDDNDHPEGWQARNLAVQAGSPRSSHWRRERAGHGRVVLIPDLDPRELIDERRSSPHG